jgi:hypothetical protein
MSTSKNAVVTPLPKDRATMVAQRLVAADRTLNDYVDDLHVELFEEGTEYYSCLEAVFNSQAVNGSIGADDFRAAQIIKALAEEKGPAATQVSKQNIETIKRSLHVVWRRYNISRKQRRTTVHGQATPDDENGSE